MAPLLLELKNISKNFTEESGAKHAVLSDVNIQIESREPAGFIASLIAPIGAGKSTLLKIISGIENQTSGSRFLNGTEYHKADGSIVYIPENPCSYPWMNVKQNVLFALKCNGNSYDEMGIKKILNDVELTGYEQHFPDENSLGFRFRISLARAISINPKIILLDDPFKRMSSETREEMYILLKNMCNNYHVVFIITTSNLVEAIILSKMLVLMTKDRGTIFEQVEVESRISELNSPFKDEKFLELLNRVELKLRERNIIDTISRFV